MNKNKKCGWLWTWHQVAPWTYVELWWYKIFCWWLASDCKFICCSLKKRTLVKIDSSLTVLVSFNVSVIYLSFLMLSFTFLFTAVVCWGISLYYDLLSFRDFSFFVFLCSHLFTLSYFQPLYMPHHSHILSSNVLSCICWILLRTKIAGFEMYNINMFMSLVFR